MAGSSSTTKRSTNCVCMLRFAYRRDRQTEGRRICMRIFRIEVQCSAVRACDLPCDIQTQPGTRRPELRLLPAIETFENPMPFAPGNRNAIVPNADPDTSQPRAQGDQDPGTRRRVLDGVIKKLCQGNA